jgi:hypothetical protein
VVRADLNFDLNIDWPTCLELEIPVTTLDSVAWLSGDFGTLLDTYPLIDHEAVSFSGPLYAFI